MTTTNKLKVLNDPIYGFVAIPFPIIFDLIQHPYFQRLRRITQMGLSYLVYPGAHHTRFQHAIGAMHLMQKAVSVLKQKNISINLEEEKALYIAILLHDIGHGPFSHALENSIVENIHHEEISLLLMEELNQVFNGELSLAIQIFKGAYERKFMLQLISSQIDMDRMDYLKRDSFYSGVAEGNINSDRLIQMMHVVDDTLVIEEKGIYSVEKFLVARRLMYWQTYLHKTGVAAELMLIKILQRAKELVEKDEILDCSAALNYFLTQKISHEKFKTEGLEMFTLLDDFDIVSALKNWQFHSDYVLQTLCKGILNREIFAIKLSNQIIEVNKLKLLKNNILKNKNISENTLDYFVLTGSIKNQAYHSKKNPIYILKKDGSIKNAKEISDLLKTKTLSKPTLKYYICYPKC